MNKVLEAVIELNKTIDDISLSKNGTVSISDGIYIEYINSGGVDYAQYAGVYVYSSDDSLHEDIKEEIITNICNVWESIIDAKKILKKISKKTITEHATMYEVVEKISCDMPIEIKYDPYTKSVSLNFCNKLICKTNSDEQMMEPAVIVTVYSNVYDMIQYNKPVFKKFSKIVKALEEDV